MKQDIILLHGALSDEKQFDALKEALQDSFVVHTFNFEGHGSRASHRPSRAQFHVENILEYANANKLPPLNLFGYSMGGYAALLFAATYPERVNKIFTLATKISWDKDISEKECALLNPEKILEKIPQFAEALKVKHTAMGWQNVLSDTKGLLTDLGKNNYLNAGCLLSITCPVKIAVGDVDKTVTKEECIWAAGLIPQSDLLVMQDTPHPFEKVNISLLKEAIHDFFMK